MLIIRTHGIIEIKTKNSQLRVTVQELPEILKTLTEIQNDINDPAWHGKSDKMKN